MTDLYNVSVYRRLLYNMLTVELLNGQHTSELTGWSLISERIILIIIIIVFNQ